MIYIAVQNPSEWTRLCTEVFQSPELAIDPRFATNPLRVANRAALDAVLGPLVRRSLTASALIDRLDSARIAYARMNSVQDFIAHPQLSERDRWRDIETPAGPVSVVVPPVTINNESPRMGPVPALGQHTDAILQELGFSPDAIVDLRKTGTV
jgi:crotonobetainyl-CoA:carnitine CoA-transferase CaiB-like acyl-CoA transferase